MPVQSWSAGQVLTAAELTSVTNLLPYISAVSANVSSAVAGTFYVVTTSSSGITVTLPVPTAGQVIGIKKTDSGTGAVTVTAGSGAIYGPGCGSSGLSSIPLGAEHAYVVLQSDGTNWHIIAGALDSGWQTFTYTNSWASNGGPAVGGTAAGYRKIGNLVKLAGSVKSGTSGNSIATLPSAYLPAAACGFASTANALAADLCAISVSTSGAVVPTFSSGTTPYLDGCIFTVD